eukprot:364341-Chlamydomonas_euryale.AAC.14
MVVGCASETSSRGTKMDPDGVREFNIASSWPWFRIRTCMPYCRPTEQHTIRMPQRPQKPGEGATVSVVFKAGTS